MELSGNSALKGYPCKDLPTTTTQSHPLQKNEYLRPKIPLKICEEDQHAKPYQKPWIYQVLQLEQPQVH